MQKALILAGGRGTDDQTRLTTNTRARQLLPVANKPILFYGLEAMREAGVVEVAIMVDRGTGEEIREAVGDGAAWRLRVTYIDQPEPHGAAHALLAAASFLGEEPFLVHFGDGLLRQSISSSVEAFLNGAADAFLLLQRVAGRRRDKTIELEEGRLRLVQQPVKTTAGLDLAGLFMFRSKILSAAGKIAPSWRGKLEMSDAIDRLIQAGGKVETQFVDSWWRYTGDPGDLLVANRLVLDDVRSDLAQADLSHSQIQGRAVIHRSAKLESTTVRGPVIIGAGAYLADCHIGPYTSIGDDVVVEGTEIEDSIIMPGATVKQLTGRLEASVVGSRSKIVRNFALPQGLRLRVGQGAEVSLT